MVRIYNVGTSPFNLLHNASGSASTNLMYCIDLINITLTPRDYVECIYDATDNGGGSAGWRVS